MVINETTIHVTCLWPTKPEQCTTILALQRTFSVLSLIGCLFIIFVIWLFKTYKYFVQRLIFILSISAAFQSFSFILGDLYKNMAMCRFQAFIMQYFGWATLLWVLCITLNIILVLRGVSNVERFEKWYHVLCWIGSIIWSAVPFIGNKYGPAGIWCWVVRDATAMRFGTWYIPIFVVILALVVAYIYIIVTVLRRTGRWMGTYNAQIEQENILLARDVKPLAAFPLIYLVLSIPTLIYRIDDAAHPNLPPRYMLTILSVISAPASGALNAVAFAFYSEIQSLLTWGQIKLAFKSRFSRSPATVTHNYDVGEIFPDNNEESVNDEEPIVA